MKTSELIAMLQKSIEERGDLPVARYDGRGGDIYLVDEIEPHPTRHPTLYYHDLVEVPCIVLN